MASAEVTLGLNAAPLIAGLRRAEGAVKGFASNLAFGGGIAGVGLLAGAFIGLKKSISAAADMETLTTSFEVMLGSGDAAQKMLKQITAFAATTPMEMPGIADAAKVLLQFGAEARTVIPTLRMLGDVAGGNEEKFKQLALVFGQISAGGKLQGGDLLQLINAGFNPLLEISKKTGESMLSLRAKMEKGAISADMVRQSFERATGAGGQFFGMMEKQSRTWTGAMSNLSDNINAMFREFGKPVMESLMPALQAAVAMTSGLGEAAAKWGKELGGALKSGVQLMIGAVQNPDAVLGAFKEYALGMFVELGDTLKYELTTEGMAFKNLMLVAASEITARFGAGLEFVTQGFRGEFATSLLDISKAFHDAMTQTFDAMAKGAKAVRDILTGRALYDTLFGPKAKEEEAGKEGEFGQKLAGLLHDWSGGGAGGDYSEILQRWRKNNPFAKMQDEAASDANSSEREHERVGGGDYGASHYEKAKKATDGLALDGLIDVYAKIRDASMAANRKGDELSWISKLMPLPKASRAFSASSLSAPVASFRLSAKEKQALEDARVASGQERAASSVGAYHAVRRGDAKRRKEFEKAQAAGKTGTEYTNSLLEKIVAPIKGTHDVLKSWG